MKCSESGKLAGFKSSVQLSELCGLSIRSLLYDFDARFSPCRKPRYIASLRKAMDEKQRRERAVMELAIIKIMDKNCT